MRVEIDVPNSLNRNTVALVCNFASSLATKLREAERKHGYGDGWKSPNWMDQCRADLMAHIDKGDPLDVAAYCAFLWYHGEKTSLISQNQQASKVEDTK